ncbi:Hypothetical protein NTJ_12535 [Nesidiocoris tenuis]|uniref:Uncharacterized protein n=1 Tax=Nesidiocoris tenuis TaxID=355587 RepID=A0ABN7B5P7_9HEMI|nr:Hypothetical protein NTJ_12535 [Nesidiocoris tenuis]
MTTWMEKYSYSTVKSTAVGSPVVSDSQPVNDTLLEGILRCSGQSNNSEKETQHVAIQTVVDSSTSTAIDDNLPVNDICDCDESSSCTPSSPSSSTTQLSEIDVRKIKFGNDFDT